MRIQRWTHIKLWGVPLHVVCLCGLVGMAIDADHIIAYWLEIPDGRFLHLPLLAGAVSIILYCGTRAGGLLAGRILRRIKMKTFWLAILDIISFPICFICFIYGFFLLLMCYFFSPSWQITFSKRILSWKEFVINMLISEEDN